MSELLRLAAVKARCGIGRTTIYELEKQGQFPKRIVLGPQTVAWDAGEVQQWIDKKKAERDAGAPSPGIAAKSQELVSARRAKRGAESAAAAKPQAKAPAAAS